MLIWRSLNTAYKKLLTEIENKKCMKLTEAAAESEIWFRKGSTKSVAVSFKRAASLIRVHYPQYSMVYITERVWLACDYSLQWRRMGPVEQLTKSGFLSLASKATRSGRTCCDADATSSTLHIDFLICCLAAKNSTASPGHRGARSILLPR